MSHKGNCNGLLVARSTSNFRTSQGNSEKDSGFSIPGNEARPSRSFSGLNRDFVFGNGQNPDVIVGGPSICREGDLLPPRVAGLSGKPLKAAATKNPTALACKLSEESPERIPENIDTQNASGMPSHNHLKGTGPKFYHAANVEQLNMEQPFTLPTDPRLSYADILKGKKEGESSEKIHPANADSRPDPKRSFYDDGNLNAMGQIIEFEGRKFIAFSAAELEELATPFDLTLIGKFSHGFPTMRVLKMKMADFNLKGEYSISLLERKHVLIRLSCEEDYTRLWSRQVLYIAGFPMRMLKWTPSFTPEVEPPFAPVWVKLPYLPIHLFNSRALFTICSMIGKPLRIDSATANLSRASTPRICVEVDLTKNILQKVPLLLDGQQVFQEVEYEFMPKYCSHCKHLGHDLGSCLSITSISKVLYESHTDLPSAPVESMPSSTKAAETQGPVQTITLSKSREPMEVPVSSTQQPFGSDRPSSVRSLKVFLDLDDSEKDCPAQAGTFLSRSAHLEANAQQPPALFRRPRTVSFQQRNVWM